MSEGDLDSICIRVGRLKITIEQGGGPDEPVALSRPSASASAAEGDSSQTSTGPLAGEAAASHEEPEPFRSPGAQFLAADTAFALSALQLGSLEHLADSLGSSGAWDGRARIARAYRAGVSAKGVIEGEVAFPVASPKIEIKNKFYICLRSSAFPQGFVATSYRDFLRLRPRCLACNLLVHRNHCPALPLGASVRAFGAGFRGFRGFLGLAP